jgi:hypothetical protein
MRSLPAPGYYWAPAAMEQLYNQSLIKKEFAGSYEPHMYRKEIEGKSAGVRVMEGMGVRIAHSARIKLKDAWHPGRELLQRTHFGLYNAQDKVMKDSHILQAAALAKLCYRIQDSGGFQLFSGVKDFIDPIELTEYHDVFADSGVGLDLPLSLVNDPILIKAGARMLAANNALMAKTRKAKWALMNVSHGLTPALRASWQKIALAEPMDSLCIAGLRGSIMDTAVGANPVAIAAHLLVGLLHPADYKHYHLLGLSSVIGMTLAAFIANLHQKVVTSDSTTYLNGQQFKNFINGTIPPRKDNYGRIKCSCPVCAYIEYEYWMDGFPTLMLLHNAEQINKGCETLNGLATIAIQKKLRGPEVARMFYNANVGLDKRVLPALGRAFDLILKTKNYAEACSIDYSVKKTMTGSLFTSTKPAPKEDLARQYQIIKRYGKYHKKDFLAGLK